MLYDVNYINVILYCIVLKIEYSIKWLCDGDLYGIPYLELISAADWEITAYRSTKFCHQTHGDPLLFLKIIFPSQKSHNKPVLSHFSRLFVVCIVPSNVATAILEFIAEETKDSKVKTTPQVFVIPYNLRTQHSVPDKVGEILYSNHGM